MQQIQTDVEAHKKFAEHFLEKGFTPGQAKLKFVLYDKRFTAAAVGMDDLGILVQNVAAALDKTQLGANDRKMLQKYAEATCHAYCKGCASNCDSAIPAMPYVSDVMRYLMYYNSYGHHETAKQHFRKIPEDIRKNLPNFDYRLAEAQCPQRMPIGKLMAEAAEKLV